MIIKFFFIAIVLLPFSAKAAEIGLFSDSIPFIGDVGNLTIEDFVKALYNAAIGIAAILMVYKLIMAGVKYMLSGVVTDKKDAKDNIRRAILGMLIILGAVTILNTINPNLTRLDFLDRAEVISGGGNEEETPDARTNYIYDTYEYPANDDITLEQMSQCEALAREEEYTSRGIELVYNRDENARTADCREVIQHYTELWVKDLDNTHVNVVESWKTECENAGGEARFLTANGNEAGQFDDKKQVQCRKAIQ